MGKAQQTNVIAPCLCQNDSQLTAYHLLVPCRKLAASIAMCNNNATMERADSSYLDLSEWVDSASQIHPSAAQDSFYSLDDPCPSPQYRNGIEKGRNSLPQASSNPDYSSPSYDRAGSHSHAVLRNTRLVAGMAMQTAETSFSPLSDSAAAWRSPYADMDPNPRLRQSLPAGSRLGFQRPLSPPQSPVGWAEETRLLGSSFFWRRCEEDTEIRS